MKRNALLGLEQQHDLSNPTSLILSIKLKALSWSEGNQRLDFSFQYNFDLERARAPDVELPRV